MTATKELAMPDTIESLAAKIADCRKRLDAAELARGPTAKIEGELDALTREHNTLVQAKTDAEQAAQQAEADQVERDAQAETDIIIERLAAVLPPIDIPTPDLDRDSIEAAARTHQRAKTDLAKLTAGRAEKQAKADTIAGLIAEHEEVVARIGDRLVASAELPSDDLQRRRSQQLLERKKPVLDAARADVVAAQKDVQLADVARGRAYEALTAVDDHARRDAYVRRIKALDAQLVEELSRVAVLNKRMRHGFEPFICSHELRTMLNRQTIEFPVLADELNPSSPRKFYRRSVA